MPIVLLTAHGESAGRVERATRYQDVLGNVTYLERPFHPTTLISVARSAIRSRRRQYEARASIERYVLLARELQHRTKNLLTVIQSIASASLPVGSARDEYFARLHALARAQDLLTEGDGRGASMGHLVEQALASFGQRAHIDGPQVFLGATTAQGFALVLHELATNAAKHGALTSPKGTLVVRWTLDSGPPAMLNFHWREQGGPAASPPKRKGFGTKLLEIAVAGGDMPPRFTYSSDGFEYEVSTPIDHAASEVP
jgi:two-component sensor histidine kinase